tara:strand:+ start:256 stop:432 length:177 start_codon:yes stop_codon:yes gene_type:complete
MENQKLDIIKKVLMLSTKTELDTVLDNVMDAISRECDQDDKDEQEFKQWKEERTNGIR